MKVRYLLRLDDACPTMHSAKWQRTFSILDRYGIRPLIGIIPHNEDPKQLINEPNDSFWDDVHLWQSKGYSLALHGYNHCYTSDQGLEGLNPLWQRSEFAGYSLEIQKDKIKKGIAIFRSHGIEPQLFFAPSHTFDKLTLQALLEESNIRIISDTIATKPYNSYGFTFIPQLGGRCFEIPIPGIWTFCLHPSAMNDNDFNTLDEFIGKNRNKFISFDDVDLTNLKSKTLIDKLLSWTYFTFRKLRNNNICNR